MEKRSDMNPALDTVRLDYRVLDDADVALPPNGRLLSFSSLARQAGRWSDVERVTLRVPLPRSLSLLKDLLLACQALRRTNEHSVILCDGGARPAKLACILNYLLPIRRRKIVLWASHVQAARPFMELKRRLARWMIKGSTITTVWSSKQIRMQAQYLGVPDETFMFLPFKSNHSKKAALDGSVGNYVFSGGNSRRDYRTLFEAVRGTDIPVIVSTTDKRMTNGLEIPSNVSVVAVRGPAFSHLMAGSRFAVFPIERGLVRGAAESSICDAMWHGKPVIAADDVSASEYIEEGRSGYVVPAGDANALRQRILELWNRPQRVSEFGRRAHQHIAANFTHDRFMRRLNQLGTLVAAG